eukprot:9309303-Pyramimonas_sp.AAC.1
MPATLRAWDCGAPWGPHYLRVELNRQLAMLTLGRFQVARELLHPLALLPQALRKPLDVPNRLLQ